MSATTRRVHITGLGLVSGLGNTLDETWAALMAGRSAIGPIAAFDPSGFDCRVAAALPTAQIKDFVPKSYRKATKVMARDIELAVIAADTAARGAGLATPGNLEDAAQRSYPAVRTACHIGASLIAAELDELTSALVTCADANGELDLHKWGREGMQGLTPLWMLKYLPNMLACHVTIVHDCQGPSNTITCAEASGLLSMGESLRVIQRGAADAGFCGGASAMVNPMTFIRQQFTGRLVQGDATVAPFSAAACGTAVGDAGGVAILETAEGARARGAKPIAEVLGFGASQSIHRARRNLTAEPSGRGPRLALEAALRDAKVAADEVDVVIATGLGHAEGDAAEAAALRAVFGQRLARIPVWSSKPALGNSLAGASAVDLVLAAQVLRSGELPPVLNRAQPLPDFGCTSLASAPRTALVLASGLAGQNAAAVLRKA